MPLTEHFGRDGGSMRWIGWFHTEKPLDGYAGELTMEEGAAVGVGEDSEGPASVGGEEEVGLLTVGGTTMGDEAEVALVVDAPAEAAAAAAAGGDERLLHEAEAGGGEDGRSAMSEGEAVAHMEAGVTEESAHVGDDAAGGGAGARKGVGAGDGGWCLFGVGHVMANGEAVGDELVGPVAEEEHVQAERLDDEVAQGGLERLAGGDLKDAADDVKAGVAVRVDLAEGRDLLEAVEAGDDLLKGVVAGPGVFEVVSGPAGGVGEEMAEGEVGGGVLVGEAEGGEVGADGVRRGRAYPARRGP